MESKEKVVTAELPFILNFLEEYKGATAVKTSGTYGDIDSADTN